MAPVAIVGREPGRRPTPAPVETRLKGVNFHGTLGALERRFGAAAVANVKARTTGDAGEALRTGAIVTGGWYPAGWYDALLGAIEAEHATVPRIVRELSYDAVTQDFKTLFRVVSLIASPAWALDGTSRIMTRYVQGGRVTVLASTEGTFHVRFDDFHGYTRRMWEDFVAGLEAVIDLMRVTRHPTKIVAGGGDGPSIEVIIRYGREGGA